MKWIATVIMTSAIAAGKRARRRMSVKRRGGPRSNTPWSSSSTPPRSQGESSRPTNPHAVLLEQDRHLERLHHPVGGGEWTPVTKSTTDKTYAVSFFPTDDRMLVTRDQGGNELNHLYVIGEDGSESDLTPGKKLKASLRAGPTMARPSTSRPTNATRSTSTSTATTRRPTRARCSTRTSTATARRRCPTSEVGGAGEGRTRPTTATSICGTRRRRRRRTFPRTRAGQLQAGRLRSGVEAALLLTDAAGEFAGAAPLRARRWPHEDVQARRMGHRLGDFSHNGRYRVHHHQRRTAVRSLGHRCRDRQAGAAAGDCRTASIRGVRISRSETKVLLP